MHFCIEQTVSMIEPNKTTYSSLGALILALLQASVLWGLHESLKSGSWPANDSAILPSLYLITIVIPLTLLLFWSYGRERILWIFTCLLTAFFLWSGRYILDGVTGPVSASTLDEDNAIANYLLPFVVAWLIAVPILRARLETGRWKDNYPSLFRGAWRTYLTVAETAFFTGVFWVLLMIWAALFDMLGINFFQLLFTDSRFVYPATTLAASVAIQLIGRSDMLLDGMLDQLLGLMKWLTPLAGLIVALFTIALLPKIPALFGSGERVIDSTILLSLVALTLLLINAAYRDGVSEPGYGKLLRQALRIVPPLLSVISVTALASIIIRTTYLGLTPARFWGLVVAVFALLFSLGYTISAARSGPWMADIRRVNLTIAVMLLSVLFISLTPFGSPIRWSVAHQLSLATTPSSTERREGAIHFLRFDAGTAGRVALDRIVSDEVRYADPVLRDQARRIQALKKKGSLQVRDPAAISARYAAWRQRLIILPEGTTLPRSLNLALQEKFSLNASRLDPGDDALTPQLVFVDLTGDGALDALLFTGTLHGDRKMVRDYVIFISEREDWISINSANQR
jgi:hypothetical protein